MKYRNSLHIFSTRLAMLSDDRLETSSHATYASLTSNEKDQRMKNLHVSNFTSGKHKRKVFQQPYRSAKDFRLTVRVELSI